LDLKAIIYLRWVGSLARLDLKISTYTIVKLPIRYLKTIEAVDYFTTFSYL